MQDASPGGQGPDDQAPEAAPKKDEAGRYEWSENDKRTLLISFLGGLGGNVGLALMAGVAFAVIRLFSKKNVSDEILLIISLLIISVIGSTTSIFLMRRLAPRGSILRGFIIGFGSAALLVFFAFAL